MPFAVNVNSTQFSSKNWFFISIYLLELEGEEKKQESAYIS